MYKDKYIELLVSINRQEEKRKFVSKIVYKMYYQSTELLSKYNTCIIKKLYNSCSLRFIWIIAVMRATNYY
jgi:hypothetical protein